MDEAPSMLGVNVGLMTQMKQHMKHVPGATDELIGIHCILHQENLCAKYVNMKNIMETVIKLQIPSGQEDWDIDSLNLSLKNVEANMVISLIIEMCVG